MTSNRDGETGRFTEQFPEQLFVDAVADVRNATTARVASEVGCSYDLAYRRLNELADAGAVVRVEVGGTFVWVAAEDRD